MKQFTSVSDVKDVQGLLRKALDVKKNPLLATELGRHKTLGLIFFNASLRTRLSSQKAGKLLGMDVMVMNFNDEGYSIETEDGVVMNGSTAEHIKEAAGVIGAYCDIIGIRSFPTLKDQQKDYSEKVIKDFIQHAGVPVISLESATRHPLQSLADLVTIETNKKVERPKVVLTWAPHPKALPHCVANSFAEWMNVANVELVITHPEGYDLHPDFVGDARVSNIQEEAFEGADFVYAKNWSSFKQYGQVLSHDPSWTVSDRQMAVTNNAHFMHCLPVRRNVIVTDSVIDSPQSLVIEQAANRVVSCQTVLMEMLQNL